MDSANTSDVITSATYIDPNKLTNFISNPQLYCLFLDIDGTLAQFTLDPKQSFIPKSTLDLLQAIQDYGIKIGVVTGRSLVEAKQMLSPLQVPVAATHGLEISWENNPIREIDSEELEQIKQNLAEACQPYPELRIENKPYSSALHYRKVPSLADISHSLILKAIENFEKWTIKPGKFVWEAVPKGINKGTAILALLQHMSHSQPLCPIFIGDDLTDEVGFKAVQNIFIPIENSINPDSNFPKLLKGIGIKVGHEPTCANYYLQNIDEVSDLLGSFLKISTRDSL